VKYITTVKAFTKERWSESIKEYLAGPNKAKDTSIEEVVVWEEGRWFKSSPRNHIFNHLPASAHFSSSQLAPIKKRQWFPLEHLLALRLPILTVPRPACRFMVFWMSAWSTSSCCSLTLPTNVHWALLNRFNRESGSKLIQMERASNAVFFAWRAQPSPCADACIHGSTEISTMVQQY